MENDTATEVVAVDTAPVKHSHGVDDRKAEQTDPNLRWIEWDETSQEYRECIVPR